MRKSILFFVTILSLLLSLVAAVPAQADTPEPQSVSETGWGVNIMRALIGPYATSDREFAYGEVHVLTAVRNETDFGDYFTVEIGVSNQNKVSNPKWVAANDEEIVNFRNWFPQLPDPGIPIWAEYRACSDGICSEWELRLLNDHRIEGTPEEISTRNWVEGCLLDSAASIDPDVIWIDETTGSEIAQGHLEAEQRWSEKYGWLDVTDYAQPGTFYIRVEYTWRNRHSVDLLAVTECSPPPPPAPAFITVVKVVINDNGGSLEVADFPLFINYTNVTSGVANKVEPNSYVVSETNQPGYAATFSGDCDANGNITVAAGESKTCTITNDDVAPPPAPAFITVVKVVINDNGGSLEVADFPLFINDTNVTSGVANKVEPNSYVVSETNQPGYAATFSGDCDANGNITVAAGESKTCTITNDDVAPPPAPAFITVVKVVINDNGGSLEDRDFPLFINDTNVTSGVANKVEPNSYVVSETNQPGNGATFGGGC